MVTVLGVRMIVDIPTPQDFEEHGLTILNLAWDTIFDPLLSRVDLEIHAGEIDVDQRRGHEDAMQKPLAIATALVQQGTELLVKSAIAKLSPALLISIDLPKWKKCAAQDIPFSELRTADAQDLVFIHNALSSTPFSDSFIQKYHFMRQARNVIFHSVDRSKRYAEKDVILTILEFTTELLGKECWFEKRSKYLEQIPDAALCGDTFLLSLIREFQLLQRLLSPAQLKLHFGFASKRERSYRCERCFSECVDCNHELVPMTAQLRPSAKNATHAYCVVCRNSVKISRQKCFHVPCRGDVMWSDNYGYINCLTCGESSLKTD